MVFSYNATLYICMHQQKIVSKSALLVTTVLKGIVCPQRMLAYQTDEVGGVSYAVIGIKSTAGILIAIT